MNGTDDDDDDDDGDDGNEDEKDEDDLDITIKYKIYILRILVSVLVTDKQNKIPHVHT